MEKNNAQQLQENGVNKRFAVSVISIFIIFLVLPSLLWGGLKIASTFNCNAIEKLNFDTGENRNFAEFPKNFDPKTITSDLESWYNDNLPFRSVVFLAKKSIDKKLENQYTQKIRPLFVGASEEIIPIYHGAGAIEGKDRWLFYRADNSEAYYSGSNILTQEETDDYINILNRLEDICNSKNIKLQIAIFPNKEHVYTEFYPTVKIENQYKKVNRWTDYAKENCKADVIYPVKVLNDAKKIGRLYFKFDTHWNDVGAYIGYSEIMKTLGYQPKDIKELKITAKDTGYIHDLIQLGNLDSTLYNDDKLYLVEYESEIKNLTEGLNFVLIGDSYKNSMSQFFYKDFESCKLEHRDDLKKENVIEEIKNADILVLEAVERYDADLIESAQTIIDILSEK